MVEVLRELGIRYIALNPGASYRGLHDSLVNFAPGEPPEVILCTHEEIAVALANGYTRATGAPMATALHNVVGLLHASMAIFNAWCDRTPMLNLGGGGPQDAALRRSTDWVHTALVQGNLVRDFVKYDDQPYSLESVPESLLRAYRIATTDPQGPVYVCLDADLQEQRMSAPLLVPDARLYRAPAAPAPNPKALREVADLLVKAEWPVIVAGEVGRTPQALTPLRELAEALAAPVIDADGSFAFPNTHSLDLTAVREQTLRAADVVLALDVPSLGVPLGPSVRERETLQLAVRPGTRIAHITLFEGERQSFVSDTMWLVPVAMPIAAHTSIALPQLLELCRHQFGSQAGAAVRIEARLASAAAMRTEAHKRSQAWIEQNWQQKPISSARLYGELNARLKAQSWALVHAHGRRWREVLEVTDMGTGSAAGVAPVWVTVCRRRSVRPWLTREVVASASAYWATAIS